VLDVKRRKFITLLGAAASFAELTSPRGSNADA
jgi:hypothetical protein